MSNQKRLSSEKKVMILREHLENQVPVSELSERYSIQASSIYNWKKSLFESAAETLSGKHKKPKPVSVKITRRIEELETTLRRREALISEIVEDNIELKKKSLGVI